MDTTKSDECITTQIYKKTELEHDSQLNTIWLEDITQRVEKEIIPTQEDPRRRETLNMQLNNIKKQVDEKKLERRYRPYAHRKHNRDLLNWQSLSMLVKAMLAAGTLRTPLSFGFAGSYNGVVGVTLILIWLSCSLHVFMYARQCLCRMLRRPYLNFSEAVKEAVLLGPFASRRFANYAGVAINVFLVYYQISVLMKYNIYLGKYATLAFGLARTKLSVAIYIIPYMILCGFFMLIRNIRRLAMLSLFANVLTCAHHGTVIFQLTGTLSSSTFRNDQVNHPLPVFYFLGNTLLVIDCLAAVLVIEKHMKHPKLIFGYAGVINLSIMFYGLWHIMLGFFGIYQFGAVIDYRYLRDLDLSRNSAISMYIVHTLAMVITFSIQAYLIIEILWSAILRTNIIASHYLGGWHLLLRSTYALLPFILVHAPHILKLVILFTGYLLGPFLTLGCPVIVHFCIAWHRRHVFKNKLYMIVDIFFLCASLIGSAAIAIYYLHALKYNELSGEF